MKNSKQLLFERMNTIGGMPLNENISLLDEEIDPTKQYVDRRTGKSYSGEQVQKWVDWFKRARRISKAERQNALSLFKAMELDPKDYTKEKWKNTNKMKLKSDGGWGYFAEEEFDGYRVRLEITPQEERRGEWCYEWWVAETSKIDPSDGEDWIFKGRKVTDDCGEMQIGQFRRNLDGMAKDVIEDYKKGMTTY
jgi:hypothetical protein